MRNYNLFIFLLFLDIFSNYMKLDSDIPNYLSDTKMINLRNIFDQIKIR